MPQLGTDRRIRDARLAGIHIPGMKVEHRRAILAVAMVSNDSSYVVGALNKLVDYVRMNPDSGLDDHQIDLL